MRARARWPALGDRGGPFASGGKTFMYAAIGDDGMRPVVWGLGRTESAAMRDARSQLHEAGCESEIHAAQIDRARVARIRAGDVEASDLVRAR